MSGLAGYDQSQDGGQVVEEVSTGSNQQKGFGAFKGVYLPSVLTILGVIMYLRLGWVVGNVGLCGTLLIVTMATSITFLTGLSISATATNMKVKGGGAYFMISRSFGIEAGAAVGIPLFLAQSIGASFYIVGFAEAVHNTFPEKGRTSTAQPASDMVPQSDGARHM